MNSTIIVLIAYLVLTFGIAWFFSRKESLEGYFLNKKKTGLWFLTISNIATLIGAGATVAIVAEVYNSGISYGIVLVTSAVSGMIIFWFLAGKIKEVSKKYDIYTIVDYFGVRYDKKNYILVGVSQILFLIFWIGIQAVAMASLASVLLDINYNLALAAVSVVAILYTAIGGLKIDIITDFIQFWIIFITFVMMSIFGYISVGGFSNLLTQLPAGHLNLFAFGGISWTIGAIVLGGFLFLPGSHHWQRIISARDAITARKSFIYSIPLLIIATFLVIFLGLVASVILGNIPKETAIFSLMEVLLPAGFIGVGFAAILAVIMSSVDSLLIGGSTIIHRALFKNKGINFARLITAIFGMISFSIAFLIPDIITLSLLQGYFALIFVPAILAGFYSKKTASASFYSILIPSIVLFVLFSIIGKNTFILTTFLSISIILFYDKFFSFFKLKVCKKK